MAHGSAGEDNPVALNVAPMVDIIFCLCIFFMCSFHFKQLEGKFESWMPKDKGPNQTTVVNPILEEVRVYLTLDTATQTVIRKVGGVTCGSDSQLIEAIQEALARHAAGGQKEAPAIIDATPEVPWKDVVQVLDLCKANRVEKVELTEPRQVR
jgi:biopolymer transport protein ExbD